MAIKNGDKIMQKIDQDSIRFWRMAVHPLSPIDHIIRRYEEDHNCCGWNNAIDYCDQKAVEDLMKAVIDEGLTEKIIKKSVEIKKENSLMRFENYMEYSSEYVPIRDYSNDADSTDNDDRTLDTDVAECTDDGYDGDEGCICNTLSHFDDVDVKLAVDVVKTTVCVHQSSLCYYSNGPSDNGIDECNSKYVSFLEIYIKLLL